MHGPVPVLYKKGLDNGEALGLCYHTHRRIEVEVDASEDTVRATLWHEVMEMALWDSGLHYLLTGDLKEAVCDVVGNYMAAAQKAGYITMRDNTNGRAP